MKRGVIFIALALLAIIGGTIALTPLCFGPSEKVTASESMQNAKDILLALALYAKEHQNRLPTQLQELTPRYAYDPKSFTAIYPEESNPTPFIYLAGYRYDQQPKVIVIHAPRPHGKDRVVGFSDATVEIVLEDEFQKLMAAQKPAEAVVDKK